MKYSIATIRRGLRNLFTERLAMLEASKAGAYYKQELHGYYMAIDAIPVSITSAPFKDQLRTTDERHDAFGKVIYLVTEACFTYPEVDSSIVAAAKQIREAFIPSLDELQSSYATEGERAQERLPLLVSLEAQLKMFRLPWDASKTLFDVATAFLNEGQKLDGLLNQRADVPKGIRGQSGILRAKAMGTLTRFRKELVKEIERDTSLPRDLEQKVFGFFDTLHSMEAAGKGHELGENEPPDANPAGEPIKGETPDRGNPG